jgi:hypothetical protein
LHPGTPTFGHSFEGHQEEAEQQSLTEPPKPVPGESEPGR